MSDYVIEPSANRGRFRIACSLDDVAGAKLHMREAGYIQVRVMWRGPRPQGGWATRKRDATSAFVYGGRP